MLNAFRMAGDLSHVVSIVVLFLRLKATGTPVGISLKTQELYLVVFLTRYLDLFTSFYSLYNTVMKIAYIAATAAIIAMVRLKSPWKFKYDRTQDAFLHWQFAVAPCAVLTPMYVLFHSGRHNWHMHWPSGIGKPNVLRPLRRRCRRRENHRPRSSPLRVGSRAGSRCSGPFP